MSGAYEILGDEKKRAAFDRGEIDAEGKPRAPQFEGLPRGRRGAGGPDIRGFNFEFGGGDFGRGGGFEHEIFAELFGGRSSRPGGPGFGARGEDVAAIATIPLEFVMAGGSWRVTLPSGKALDVEFPAGVDEGKSIRLRGQGSPGDRRRRSGRRDRHGALCRASVL